MGRPRSSVPIFQVDAFTNEPFRGNPAAVCLLEEPARVEWMQAFAAEMNLSETAYVVPRGDEFDLRWFTPAVEVQLCGHATLASAHVLFERERVAPGTPIAFHTRSGVLTAEGAPGRIELDFPAYQPTPGEAPPGLAEALGARPRAFSVVSEQRYSVAELDDAAAVRELRPDFAALRSCIDTIAVTAISDDDGSDFVSRYFAPGAGIDEDPVTGSAHCVLAPYWAARLGRGDLTGYQASSRGGFVSTRLVRSAGGEDRVMLAGDAVTVWRGTATVS